jgi:hypothetical protein
MQRLFLANHLKTNGFWWILDARIGPEQGEKGDNREKQGANSAKKRVKEPGGFRA